MLILLDIGNTSVTYAQYADGRFRKFGSMLFDAFPKFAAHLPKSGVMNRPIDLVVSSVVPKNTKILKKLLSNQRGPKAWIVGENLPISIRHRYHSPRKLGVDRIVNIYGALRSYSPPFLIIDFGTAVTLDYVSKDGVFRGGMIIPGPEVAFQSLIERAALLPKKVRLPCRYRPSRVVGQSTYECMSAGILQGYGAMTDGLVQRFQKRYGPLKVIATGGFARHLQPYASTLRLVDPRHSMKSLLHLFSDFCDKTSRSV